MAKRRSTRATRWAWASTAAAPATAIFCRRWRVFLTPLSQWNPTGIEFADDDADWVTKAGSESTLEHNKIYCATPIAFQDVDDAASRR